MQLLQQMMRSILLFLDSPKLCAAIACVCRPAAGMKLERVNPAAGRINSRLRSNMKHSTLSLFVLAQEWLTETLKVVDAPRRGLIDLAAWRISLGGDTPSNSETDSDYDTSDSDEL